MEEYCRATQELLEQPNGACVLLHNGAYPRVARSMAVEWRLPQQHNLSKDLFHGGNPPPKVILRASSSCTASGADFHSARSQLVQALYFSRDPFDAANASVHDVGYPHSGLRSSFVRSVLQSFKPLLWVEVGAFIGNSAVMTAAVAAHLCMRDLSVVSVDPFTGDQMMWNLHRFAKVINGTLAHRWGYDFLALTADGRPTIRDRYMANVLVSGAAPWVLPITAPGLVGMRLLKMLHASKKLAALPQVLFLDSAHEADETRLELEQAFKLLAPGGLLFGDDWSWEAVRNDVTGFAEAARTRDRFFHADEPGPHLGFVRAAADNGLDCVWHLPAVMLCAPSVPGVRNPAALARPGVNESRWITKAPFLLWAMVKRPTLHHLSKSE